MCPNNNQEVVCKAQKTFGKSKRISILFGALYYLIQSQAECSVSTVLIQLPCLPPQCAQSNSPKATPLLVAGLDACARGHNCEHMCVNNNYGDYYCKCREGFVLNEDMKTCSKQSKMLPAAIIITLQAWMLT